MNYYIIVKFKYYILCEVHLISCVLLRFFFVFFTRGLASLGFFSKGMRDVNFFWGGEGGFYERACYFSYLSLLY